MRSNFWVLDGHTPVQVDDVEAWARHPAGPEARYGHGDHDPWRVDRTEIGEQIVVSTVFLGLDHQWLADGPPLLFETMVFGLDDDDEWVERCPTWDEALAMHADAVAHVRSSL